MPCPFVVKAIQRVPYAPPGFTALFNMVKLPTGVGVEGLPTATGYVLNGTLFIYNVSVFWARDRKSVV